MRHLRTMALAALAPFATLAAAGGDLPAHGFQPNIDNTASLQRGAKYFVNYCLGCHTMQYVRYQSLADALDLSVEQVEANLMFTAENAHEVMHVAMPAEASERWFGATPPDLSLIARSRGPAYLYSFLTTFYVDEGSRTGTGNLALPGASMPHVLWELEGYKRAVFRTEEIVNEDGSTRLREVFDSFEEVAPGELTQAEYQQVVGDIVNFLVWAGEPMALERQRLGVYVILFLLVFLLFAVLLKKEYWKDVH